MWQNLHIVFRLNMRHLVKCLTQSVVRGTCAVMFLFNASCDNQFGLFADTGTNLSLYYSVVDALSEADYTRAVSACETMEADYLLGARVAEACASAYAGRCGFTFIGEVTNLANFVTASPPQKLFEWYFMQITSSTAAQINDCSTAEDIIRSSGAAEARSDDLNALMLLINVRTISLISDETADNDDDNLLDGGFDACSTITASLAAQLGSAIWELDKSLDVLSSKPEYAPFDFLMDTACGALSGIGQDVCGAADPESLSAAETKGAQTFLKEGLWLGVDQCGGNQSAATCNCP